jgi:uroporphyrinogen-III synthase
MRVLAFESRRADEMRSLIERHGGVPVIAPALREIALGMTPELTEFVQRLRAGTLDAILFLTGVGADALREAIAPVMPEHEFFERIQQCRIIIRGPKPQVVLKRWNVRIDARADEPNTWREVLNTIDAMSWQPRGTGGSLQGLRFAVQEYGGPARELMDGLMARGAETLPVPVYRWALPDDIQPVRDSIHATIRGEFDVLLLTTAQHAVHVLQIAEQMGVRDEWLAATRRCVMGSIGPTASEQMRECGLSVDVEPEHPKMGPLVRETLEQAPALLLRKRSAKP